MENLKHKKIVLFSSKSGGPYHQYVLLKKELEKKGYIVYHYWGFVKWVKLHFTFNNQVILLSSIPFFFYFSYKNFYLNIHGNYHLEKSLSNILSYLYDHTIKWANKIITPNSYLKEKLKIKNIFIIENLVEKIFVTKTKKDKNIINIITVTNFSFLSKGIGVVNIVKALSFVKSNSAIVFNVYGKGKYFQEIYKKCKLIKVPKNIRINFCGYDNEIIKRISESDIFAYWSELDVSPTCLTEAMAVSLPVIVNNYKPLKDCINGNIICDNINDFSRAIEKLIENKNERMIIGRKNRQFWEKKYLYNNNIINKWIKILNL